MLAKIKDIQAREILDSRGKPTVEVMVRLDDGSTGFSAAPSGASTGKNEAATIVDGDPDRFDGQGVLTAVANVQSKISPKLLNQPAHDQEKVDRLLIDLDGTGDKSGLGANAILPVSQAVLAAAAQSLSQPLYRHVKRQFGFKGKPRLPKPVFNLINAGLHGPAPVEFQEFEILPHKTSFAKALETGEEIYQALGRQLAKQGLSTAVGDEGGYSPDLLTNLDGLEQLFQAIVSLGIEPGKKIFLGLDTAASNFYKGGSYRLVDFSKPISASELWRFYRSLIRQYHLLYLEDPFAEDDLSGWRLPAKDTLSAQLMIVGDDLLVTDKAKIAQAAKAKLCQAAIIKPNQIGTVTETVAAVKTAQLSGLATVFSHRSGETTDTFIVDLAVGLGADYVKFGAPARGERVVKYNRLLRIEAELGFNRFV